MKPDPFGASRQRLLGLAYRMLGSRCEAEDVLQDAWIRFDAVHEVGNRDALLTTIVTRLCLDRLKSARVRREAYIGPWLPEPVTDTQSLAPDSATELANDLSFALLLTLERLKPAERAAFLLHDVFAVPFVEIAATLNKSELACRQLAARARKAVRDNQRSTPVSFETHQRLMSAFGVAVASGDIAALTALLHKDAVMLSDGGGNVVAALNPIVGADRIARFFIGAVRKFGAGLSDLRVELVEINGGTALMTHAGEQVDQVLQFSVREGRIATVYVVRNPDKLRWIQNQFALIRKASYG